ncbi:type III secretion system effector E3 ubiquitin ligase NleL [Escherichia coli]|nr:type III secretion system effector E3 ubiquitin ligase NleL [Escherichia coli]EIG7755958.1 type III secretion system effector E3 ubiquitin ligase NleL [Escherichia coli]HDJ0036223.1 type III secretion system effector E3 ubiquitin ligase NleL [Escherichia coli]
MLPTTNISVNSGVISFESPVDSPSNEDVEVALEKWCAEGEFSENRHEVASKILDVISTNGETLSISEPITTLPDLLPGSLKELVLNGCTELKSINCLPPNLSSLSMVGCSSLEVINCSIPENVINLSLCHCSSLKHIEGSFPEALRNSVYLNGCNSLNESQCQFLAYDVSQGRACLSKAELTADLIWLSANRTGEESAEELNYSGCDLSGLSLVGLNLSSVNFSGAVLDDTDLRMSDLSQAVLENCSFKNSILNECNFCYANLSNCIIRALFENSNFSNSNLKNASFKGSSYIQYPPILNEADLTGAIIIPGMVLSGAILGDVKELFSEKSNTINLGGCYIDLSDIQENILSVLDNYTKSNKSILLTMNTSDDKYNHDKVRVAEELIKKISLDELAAFRPYVKMSLADSFSIHPYLNNANIQQWLEPICDDFFDTIMSWFNNSIMMYMENGSLLQAGMYFERHPGAMVSYNSSFIQIVMNGSRRDGMQERFRELYEVYLKNEKVYPVTQQSDFGLCDGSGKPDWDDDSDLAYNWVLLSSQDDGMAMMCSLSHMVDMLSPNTSTNWMSFFLYKDGEVQNTFGYSLSNLFSESFPIFSIPYHKAFSQNFVSGILDILISDNELKERFIEALNSNKSDYKMIADDQQRKLACVWNPFLDGWELNAQHVDMIMGSHVLKDMPLRKQAEILFCLGGVFCKYSSSDMFGTEYDSPEILRRYANGLIEQAYKTDPQVFGSVYYYNDILDRLQGRNNVFTCTAVLTDMLTEHAKESFPEIFSLYYPVAWR